LKLESHVDIVDRLLAWPALWRRCRCRLVNICQGCRMSVWSPHL